MTTVENVFRVKTIFFTGHVIYFPHEIWKAQSVSVMHRHTAPVCHLCIYLFTVTHYLSCTPGYLRRGAGFLL